MNKVMEKLVVLVGMLLWILTCFWGYFYGEVIAIIMSSILPFGILPIRNLLLPKQVSVKRDIYYVVLLILLLSNLYFTIQNLGYSIFESEIGEYYKFHLVGLLASYLFLLVFFLISLLFKKDKSEKVLSYNSFAHMLILFPAIVVLASTILMGDSFNTSFINRFSALIFFVSFLGNMIKNRNIIRREEYQKLYFVLFISGFLFGNLLALFLIPVLYFQLDKIGII